MAVRLSIDRIENDIAACEMEDRTMKMIPLSLLPDEVKEGDIIFERGGKYIIDKAETQIRRDENIRLMKMLLAKKETGFSVNKPDEE